MSNIQVLLISVHITNGEKSPEKQLAIQHINGGKRGGQEEGGGWKLNIKYKKLKTKNRNSKLYHSVPLLFD